ncbi:sirohydrochlorin cobaltochelatase [Butyricicoccus intestinisimiae]|uniref:Sirohydrochlorin cobaltochelatase n=1 Tax=Butyricicoccus intestinisimiae TaxID=2841509 RepID=A0ABS6EU93_9FIRM|nr:sirohydrochlorin cobaltochelatase [Butyricicoccus intestinisimiae]MBU5490706.1 sirohydrochlorin cobaltochelatase [Butyricicoccus intestinisimiae]
MKMKKLTAMLLAGVLAAGMLAGCGSSNDNSKDAAKDTGSATTSAKANTGSGSGEAAEEEENYNTGDASKDNPRNQDNIGENELLVLSFGTSFNDSRRLTIGAIEDQLEKSFPDYSVRRGFTANIVIDHVAKRDGEKIDDIDASLKRAVDNGVKNLVVQPTHLMNGLEYEELKGDIAQYSDAFDKIAIGQPLLSSDDDFSRVENAIVDWTKDYDDGETAIVFMGHGTSADSNGVYQKMQDLLTKDGHTNYFVGTVEATPSLDDVLAAVKKGGYKRVVLEPLMVVAGDHANNDMAGDDKDSWKSQFEAAGYQVECLLRGLGENETIRQIYVEHAQAAIDSLNQ